MKSAGKSVFQSVPFSETGLPTLGLNRYRNQEIKNDSINPFSVQRETEKLLIARERERDFRDSNKLHQESLRVFQKGIQTRQNRAGAIREINSIKPSKSSKYYQQNENQLALLNASDDQIRQKYNIFDENSNGLQKYEKMIKIGMADESNNYQNRDDQSFHSKASMSQTYSSSHYDIQAFRPKVTDYLSKGRENKETARDFVLNARNILVAQISINDKSEETERLKEYIIMEKEKLQEAKKTFDEDKDKFQKYMDDLNRKAEETAFEVSKLISEKNEKMDRISELMNNIQLKKSKTKQIEEKLNLYKQHKKFLDGLAVSAGRKQARTKVKQQVEDISAANSPDQQKINLMPRGKSTKKELGQFFLTQINQNGGNIVQKRIESLPIVDEFDKELNSFSEKEDNGSNQGDGDFEIYFDKFTLLDHLAHLEEDNLFKIHLIQEDEQALEKLRKGIDQKVKVKEKEIADVQMNIEILQQSIHNLGNKLQFLESNMKVKSSLSNHESSKAVNNWVGASQKDKKAAFQNPNQNTNQSMELSSDKQNPFTMLQQLTGCSKDQLGKLSSLISNLLEKVGIKQEDQSNKLEMIRKIEQKLLYLTEARDFIAIGNKKKDLEKKEVELHNNRKQERIQKKKIVEEELRLERQKKNMARIKKQEELKIFHGRRETQRAKKEDLRPKEKNDDKPSQVILDQLKYIGVKVFEDEQKLLLQQQAQLLQLIAYDKNPNLRHLLKSVKELRYYRRLKYQGIGRAVETVDLMIDRFVKYDIGDIYDIRTFFTNNELGRQVKGKSFYLAGKHTLAELEKLSEQIQEMIRCQEIYSDDQTQQDENQFQRAKSLIEKSQESTRQVFQDLSKINENQMIQVQNVTHDAAQKEITKLWAMKTKEENERFLKEMELLKQTNERKYRQDWDLSDQNQNVDQTSESNNAGQIQIFPRAQIESIDPLIDKNKIQEQTQIREIHVEIQADESEDEEENQMFVEGSCFMYPKQVCLCKVVDEDMDLREHDFFEDAIRVKKHKIHL
ncbi:UNKNOWN [Stylonychia lemnae]|uniref:DUF4200 domain-containing protein n=1 Tax=Stylonychia lemnae TaxID=5949 RepID=A0A078APW6_STYLE|nr:UNKNOWN [Stylonychia lemnae]|eukprot:CDW84021.1 UNKNOWN [Stylonychia lemnae]